MGMIRRLLDWINRRVGYLPIRTKFLIAFALLSGIPMALAGLVGSALAGRALENLALQRLNAEVETYRASLETDLRAVESDVVMLASSPHVVAAVEPDAFRARQSLLQEWESFLRAKPTYHRLLLLNPWAEEVVRVDSARSDSGGQPLRTQPFYLHRLAETVPGETIITPVEIAGDSVTSILSAVSFAQAVYDADGYPLAVVVAEVLASKMFSTLEVPTDSGAGSLIIVDREGHYVFNSTYRDNWNAFLSERSSRTLHDRYPDEIVGQLLSGTSGGVLMQGGDIVSFQPILQERSEFHVLIRSVPHRVVLAPVGELRLVLMVLFAASLGVAAVLGIVAAHHFNYPLKQLLEGARRLAHGDYAHRIYLGTFDEIDDLADTFNSMAEAVEHREERIRSHADELEEKVEQRTGELLRAERQAAAGQLVAGIAHEIGTPLNLISGSAEQVLSAIDADRETEEDLRLIVAETQRIAKLVRDLQDFARPRPARHEGVDMAAVAEDVIRLLRGSASKAGVNIELVSDLDTPNASADSMEVKQALLNLILNAIDASPRHGTVVVQIDGDGDDVRVRIVDEGIGVPPENKARIFEPFFTTKRPHLGTGLGLAIVRRIVERHNGRIEVRSRRGKGTTFEMRIPREVRDGFEDR